MSFLPRMQLSEIHDNCNVPNFIRHMATSTMGHLWQFCWYHEDALPILQQALRDSKETRILDLCCGSGGVTPFMLHSLKRRGLLKTEIQITLSDLHPNVASWKKLQARMAKKNPPLHIDYSAESVDAAKCTQPGLRTVLAGFHHLFPSLAKQTLQNAVDTQNPIFILEFTERSLYNILFYFPLIAPLNTLLDGPFVKPWSWTRLFFTYVIPLMPLVMAIDGTLSCLRTWSVDEMKTMVAGLHNTETMDWSIGRAYTKPWWSGPNFLYLIGVPKLRKLQ